MDKENADIKLGMVQGIVLAAAQVCRNFDQPTIAKDILDSASISNKELKLCADYDLAALREAHLTKVRSVH